MGGLGRPPRRREPALPRRAVPHGPGRLRGRGHRPLRRRPRRRCSRRPRSRCCRPGSPPVAGCGRSPTSSPAGRSTCATRPPEKRSRWPSGPRRNRSRPATLLVARVVPVHDERQLIGQPVSIDASPPGLGRSSSSTRAPTPRPRSGPSGSAACSRPRRHDLADGPYSAEGVARRSGRKGETTMASDRDAVSRRMRPGGWDELGFLGEHERLSDRIETDRGDVRPARHDARGDRQAPARPARAGRAPDAADAGRRVRRGRRRHRGRRGRRPIVTIERHPEHITCPWALEADEVCLSGPGGNPSADRFTDHHARAPRSSGFTLWPT